MGKNFVNHQNEADAHFDRKSWLILLLALFIVAYGLGYTFYYLSLPSDGWLTDFELNEANPSYIFSRYNGSTPSPIRPDDVLIAVEGQPLASLVEQARTLQLKPPPSWIGGGTIEYTVLRQGQIVTLTVPLQNRATPTLNSTISDPLINALSFLLVLPIWLIGPAVFFLRPRLTAARLLLLFSACFVVGSEPVGGWNFLSIMFDQPALRGYTFFNVWVFGLIPLMVHLMFVFPEVKKPVRRYPWLTLAAIYGTAPLTIWLSGWLYRYQVIPADTVGLLEGLVFIGAFVTLFSAASHSLLTLRDPVAKAQMRWITFGVLAGFMGGVGIYFLGLLFSNSTLFELLLNLTIPILPICLAIAILRYRLFDIDILIRRTLVYGILTALLALVYFGTVVLLQAVFRVVTGQGQSELVTVLSTLAIAALFTPLRRQVQRLIDRRFYRSKYNAAQTLAAFAATARDEVDLNAMTAELLHVVEATMQPAHMSVWLRPARSENGGHP